MRIASCPVACEARGSFFLDSRDHQSDNPIRESSDLRINRLNQGSTLALVASTRRSAPRTDARTRGKAVGITSAWQEDVIKALARKGISEPQLAKLLDVAQSTVYTTLHSKTAKHSSIVARIHEVLGWNPPPDAQAPVVLPSADAIEMGKMFDRLPERIRAKMRDDAKMYLELLGDPKAEN